LNQRAGRKCPSSCSTTNMENDKMNCSTFIPTADQSIANSIIFIDNAICQISAKFPFQGFHPQKIGKIYRNARISIPYSLISDAAKFRASPSLS